MMTKRKTELDVAKALALLSVVLGHVIPLHGTFSNWIFSFHMPVFFFLTGMTFRPGKYAGFGAFVRDKWKKRIVPYLIIVFVGFVICMLRPTYREPVLHDGWRYQLLWIFYYARPMNLYIGQSWYLVALFMAELYAYGWLWVFDASAFGGEGKVGAAEGRYAGTEQGCSLAGQNCGQMKPEPVLAANVFRRSPAVRFWSLVLLAWAAVLIPRYISWIPVVHRLPWKMDSGLCGAVFLLAGYGASRCKLLEKASPWAWYLFPVCLCLSYFFGPSLFGHSNICECLYPAAPYYYAAAFAGIGAVLMAAVILKRSRFLAFCGRYTLPMFAAQTFAIYFVVEAIWKVTGVWWEPMQQMPGKVGCLLITAAAFGLMVLFVLPWHVYRERKMKHAEKA